VAHSRASAVASDGEPDEWQGGRGPGTSAFGAADNAAGRYLGGAQQVER
jgi:hypothetical protein